MVGFWSDALLQHGVDSRAETIRLFYAVLSLQSSEMQSVSHDFESLTCVRKLRCVKPCICGQFCIKHSWT